MIMMSFPLKLFLSLTILATELGAFQTNGSHGWAGLNSRANLRPREVQRGRCTEVDPTTIERYERQFSLDRAHGLSSTFPNLQERTPDSPTRRAGLTKRQTLQNPIDVWFHVISADTTPENGNVPLLQVIDQIDALNLGFGPPGLRFALRNVTRTVNADWFNNGGPGTSQQDAMKASLRQGGPAVLNIYSVNFSGTWSSLLGYSTFPQTYASAPTDDGIVIHFASLPGGPLASYNQGKTGVHETGHWVGLYHTFQGSCFDPGDYVADTQPEATPSEGCMEGRATCVVGDVLEGEVDPIHNYMDYSPDACMYEFTPGQADRARMQLMFYRGIAYH